MASLVKEIDRVIQANPNKKVGSYVNFIGDDFERLKTAATEFGEKHKISQVPLVVPGGPEIGGSKYWLKPLKINADAEVTVIIYQLAPGKVVKANHAFGKGSLNATAIAAIVADIERHLP